MKTFLAIALALPALVLSSVSCQQGPCSSPQNPHLGSCTDVCCGDGKNPPTSGGHCADWLPCRVYTAEQNRCQWVHNLEHGHLVLLYNCPSGCPEIVTALQDIWQSRPAASNGARRALVSPDPEIPGKVAAVVFGHSWVGDSLDQAEIDRVIAHQDEPGVPEAGLLCLP
ncbi:MAG TPA: DUF3105 domain-containing protein [Myxococcaceae bacterium]